MTAAVGVMIWSALNDNIAHEIIFDRHFSRFGWLASDLIEDNN